MWPYCIWALICEFLEEWLYLRGFGLFLRLGNPSILELHRFSACCMFRIQAQEGGFAVKQQCIGTPRVAVTGFRAQACDVCRKRQVPVLAIPTGANGRLARSHLLLCAACAQDPWRLAQVLASPSCWQNERKIRKQAAMLRHRCCHEYFACF